MNKPATILITWLWETVWIRRIAAWLRLPERVNCWLQKHPVYRTKNGIKYRFRSLESWTLVASIKDQYPDDIFQAGARTLCDLGSNVGLFALLFKEYFNGDSRAIKGLCIDGNPNLIEDCRWHLISNGLTGVKPIIGAVGCEGEHVTFHVHRANISSALNPNTNPDGWTPIKVRVINVEKEWVKAFGDIHCSMLKMNIEGVELNFFRLETQFLKRVSSIIVEVHAFGNSLSDVIKELHGQGFYLAKWYGAKDGYDFCLFKRNVAWDSFSDVQDKNQHKI